MTEQSLTQQVKDIAEIQVLEYPLQRLAGRLQKVSPSRAADSHPQAPSTVYGTSQLTSDHLHQPFRWTLLKKAAQAILPARKACCTLASSTSVLRGSWEYINSTVRSSGTVKQVFPSIPEEWHFSPSARSDSEGQKPLETAQPAVVPLMSLQGAQSRKHLPFTAPSRARASPREKSVHSANLNPVFLCLLPLVILRENKDLVFELYYLWPLFFYIEQQKQYKRHKEGLLVFMALSISSPAWRRGGAGQGKKDLLFLDTHSLGNTGVVNALNL